MTAVASTNPTLATRTQRSAWNYLSGLLLAATNMLVGLYATPKLIHWLGQERFGAYRAMSDLSGYLTLVELGTGGAMLAVLARYLGQRDSAGVRRTLFAGVRAYFRIAAVMAICGAGLAFAITRLVSVSDPVRPDLQRAFLLGLISIALVPLNPFRWLAEAGQCGYVITGWLMVQSLLITGISLGLARAGWGITGQAIAAVMGIVVFQAALTADGWRRHPELHHRDPTDEHQTVRLELSRLGRPIFILHICVMVGLLSDNLIIGKMLGAAMVTPFFVTQRLITIAVSQVRGLSNATWASLTELHATGQTEIFAARVIEITSLIAVLGLATLVPIAAFNHAFIGLWVGEQTYAGQTVTILAVINGLLASVLSVWIWLFDGTGQAARLVPMAVIGAVLNVAASILCTKLFQLPGPLIGTTLAYAGVQFICLPVLVRRTFGIPIARLIGALAAPVAIAIPLAAMCGWVSVRFPPQTWLMLAIAMSLAAGLYLIIAWLTLLTQNQKALWIKRARLAFSLSR